MATKQGYRLFYREDRKQSPYLIQWKDPLTRKRKFKSFASEEKRAKFIKDFGKDHALQEKYLLQFDAAKWRKFLAFEKRIGGIEFLDAAARAFENLAQQKTGDTFEAMSTHFLEDKLRQGIEQEQYSRYENLFKRLSEAFPHIRAGEITAEEITRWIEVQTLPDGRRIKPTTKNNLRKLLKAFYNWAVQKRKLSHNPVAQISRWGTREDPVGILTVEQGERLFQVNRDQPCIGRLALEAFAGLRYSSARDLKREEIVFEEKGIHLPASNIKTRRRFYVDGFPDNLWQWLRHAPESCWQIKPRQYLEAKKHAFIRANIPHPHNCLRHSFCTYHVAAFKDVGKTATLLCHNSLAMLNRHYRGNATQAEGTAWFQILP